jgi:hypothetical protein
VPAPPEADAGTGQSYWTDPDASCEALGTWSVIGCPLEAAVDLIEARLEMAELISDPGS